MWTSHSQNWACLNIQSFKKIKIQGFKKGKNWGCMQTWEPQKLEQKFMVGGEPLFLLWTSHSQNWGCLKIQSFKKVKNEAANLENSKLKPKLIWNHLETPKTLKNNWMITLHATSTQYSLHYAPVMWCMIWHPYWDFVVYRQKK